MPDFTNLPLSSVIATLLLLAAIDTVGGIAIALINGNFSGSYVLSFLQTHILKIATPIFGLAFVGHGFNAFGVTIPAIPVAGAAASASLLAYAVSVVASLRSSFGDKALAPDSAPATAAPGPDLPK